MELGSQMLRKIKEERRKLVHKEIDKRAKHTLPRS